MYVCVCVVKAREGVGVDRLIVELASVSIFLIFVSNLSNLRINVLAYFKYLSTTIVLFSNHRTPFIHHCNHSV